MSRNRMYWLIVLLSLQMLGSIARLASAEEQAMRIYIGTYTGGRSEGIYMAEYDATSGTIGTVQLAARSDDPSFIAIHPKGKSLYAVGEVGNYEGEATGFVRSFAIDAASGTLSETKTLKSDGAAPCHIVVDRLGSTVLVANYMGGNVAAFSLLDDGRLGKMTASFQHRGQSINERRQEAPHAHSINLDPDNRFAFAADLGIDKVVAYRFDPKSDSRLQQTDAPKAVAVPPGSGPRHFAFHPTGRFAYVINEILSTVTAFRYDATHGVLTATQNVSTLPEGFEGESHTAEVVVHPTGKFVYGSNRGHDSIAVFHVDIETGGLSQVQVESTGGKAPRNFVVDPAGRFLLAENQGSDTIKVFKIDPESGRISATGVTVEVPSPVCIRFWSDKS